MVFKPGVLYWDEKNGFSEADLAQISALLYPGSSMLVVGVHYTERGPYVQSYLFNDPDIVCCLDSFDTLSKELNELIKTMLEHIPETSVIYISKDDRSQDKLEVIIKRDIFKIKCCHSCGIQLRLEANDCKRCGYVYKKVENDS